MGRKKAFTLIELLIVIAILGSLAALITGNFFNSLKKGRDARRKQDLQNIQKGLEQYYEDTRRYPATLTLGSTLCNPAGCGTRTYMQKVPSDPSSFTYYYATDTDGTYYKLYSCIESDLDEGENVDQAGYSGTDCSCGVGNSACKFAVSSSNTGLP